MKRKDLFYVGLAIVIIFTISGCSTVPKKFQEEVAGVKARVETLETRVEGVETKQVEAERAASEHAQAIEELKTTSQRPAATNIRVKARVGKSREGIKQIQLCLKNAGFYAGNIDGVRGRSTRKAIREFQKANGLKADAVVGPKTWELLNKYASGAAAQTTPPVEEGAK